MDDWRRIDPDGANDTAMLSAVPSRDLGGFMLNMMLGLTCVSLSVPIGIALALGRQSSLPLIKIICVVFIEFIRGVPLITLLFVANVMLAYFFPPGSGVDLFLRVVIMITMFSAAYIAEVIRGGLAALPKGQYEAADSLGLDYPQAMRLIILPQALKISIPGIVNVAVGPLQRHNTGVCDFYVRPCRHDPRTHSCLNRMERHLLGALHVCFRPVLHPFAMAFHNIRSGSNAVLRQITVKGRVGQWPRPHR